MRRDGVSGRSSSPISADFIPPPPQSTQSVTFSVLLPGLGGVELEKPVPVCEASLMISTISQMCRVRLNIAYLGGGFHGWASQPGLRTVQGELEAALAQVLHIPAGRVALTVAGRTDAGVHAAGQVAHFDVPDTVWEALPGRAAVSPSEALVRKVNAVLARGCPGVRGYTDVVVNSARQVPETFDARFSALWRAYTYRIADGPALWRPQCPDVLWVAAPLDVSLMNRAAQPLLGEHDFLSYSKPRPGASTVRTLQRLEVIREEGIVCVHARADAFCHSQVRTLVGTLAEVGRGAKDVGWPQRRLLERSRTGEVKVAPAHGLTLESVGYPPPGEYASQALRARRYRG